MWKKLIRLKGAYVFTVAVMVSAVLTGCSFFGEEEFDEELHIAVTVTPYYRHTSHQAEVGKYSDGLGSADNEVLLKTIEDMDKDWENLLVAAMYVAALRLFEIGERDRALYWYQGAKYRADLFIELLDASSEMNRTGSKAHSLGQAHTAFLLALKTYFSGYGLCDIRKYEKAMDRAVLKRDVMPKLNKIYPEVVFLSEEQWPGEVGKVNTKFERRVKHTANAYNEIVKQRKAAGIHAQYCGEDQKSKDLTQSREDAEH